MHQPEVLKREVKALVFDQYGTIVDMQMGLTEVLSPFLASKSWKGSPDEFITSCRRTLFENWMIDALLDRGHTPYRQIWHRALVYEMARNGIPHTHEELHGFADEIEKLKPFPDVPAALERLKRRGYVLAVLSNGDPDMLKAAAPHIGFAFDHIISVQQAGYFKPHRKAYAKAVEIMGVDRTSCLFVASHAFDCVGAKAFGMRTVYVNRRKLPFGETPHQPDLVVGDFGDLADILCEHPGREERGSTGDCFYEALSLIRSI
jgi:2-haloacid dehalogenase